jgi:hypothetical protein
MRRESREEKPVRRTFTLLTLFTVTVFLSACGGSSNTSVNAGGRDDTDTTVNSERIDSSNMAPTGGPGPEPESRGTQSAGNPNESKTDNKNKGENKNKAENKNTR